jgi:hypothetical protein
VSIRGFGLAVDLLSVKPLDDYASTSEMLKATALMEYQGIVKGWGTRQTTEPGVKLEFEDWEGGRREEEDAGKGFHTAGQQRAMV